MSFFEKFEAAMGNKDLDAMMELMHPDWTMVMHSTGKVLDLNDWREMFSKIIAGDNFNRCQQINGKCRRVDESTHGVFDWGSGTAAPSHAWTRCRRQRHRLAIRRYR